MADHERLSLAARIWEREQLRKFGLLDVPWEARHCCDSCRVPAQKPKASAGTPEEVQDQEEVVPPSGTRERWQAKPRKRRKQS